MKLKTHNRIKWRYLVVFTLILFINSGVIAQNNGLVFDGLDEEVQVGPLSVFDGATNQSFTIEAWFNPAQTVNKGTVWSIGVNSGESLRLKQVAGGGMALDNIDGDVLIGSSPAIATNRWHHSAVVYDGSDLTLYIDGIEEGKTTIALTMEGTGLRIGRGTFDFSNFWEGGIDEIRIWNYARSTQEIFNYLFLNIDGTEDGLVHSYDFNETTGTVLPDLAGGTDGSTVNMEDSNWQASDAIEKQLNQASGAGVWTSAGIWSRGVPLPIDSVVIGSDLAPANVTVDESIVAFDLIVQGVSSLLLFTDQNISLFGDMRAINNNNYSVDLGVKDTIFLKGADQQIEIVGNTVGTLYLEGSGTKTFTDPTDVSDGVFIDSGATMFLLSSGFTLTETAFFNNTGSEPVLGTLNFSGTAHTISSTSQIQSISVSSAATITLGSDLSLLSDFIISNQGILDMQNFSISAPENWDLSGVDTIRWTSGAKIIIDKNISSFFSGVGSEPVNTTYPTMEITEDGYLFLSDNIYIEDSESLILNGGFLEGNFSNITIGQSARIDLNSGTFECESCNIGMGNNATITNNGGNLSFRGGEGDTRLFGNDLGEEYEVIQNDGLLQISETQFSNLKGGGLTITGGQIDQLAKITFSDSENADSYLTFNGDLEDDITFSEIEFNTGPANNVRKLSASGNGNINIATTTGNFTGPAFELVEAGSITWVNIEFYDDFGLDFRGSGQYVQVSGGPAFTAPFTVEAWVKPFNTGSGTIVGWDLDAGGGEYASFGFASGALQIYAEDGVNGGPLNDAIQIPTFSWVHVAVTYNGVAFQFYINGELSSSGLPVGSVGGAPNNLYIGSRNSSTDFFRGEMDEVRIWGDVRTQTEIKDNLYTELTGGEADLLNYYNFNEASGTVLNDQSGSAENGTLNNFAVDDTDWIPLTDKPESKEFALNFDGVDDFAVVSGLNYVTDFTLEAWVRLDDNNGRKTIASWDFDTSPYALLNINDGRVEFETFDGFTAFTVSAPDSIAPSEWYHIALIKQATDVEIFINGRSKITGTIVEVSGSSNFRIGNYESEGNLGFMDGNLDEIRLWNTALEVQTIRDYASTTDFTGHPALGNFLFYANFNQGIVPGGNNSGFNTLPDLVSSGFTGTLDPGFALNGFEGNYINSEAFKAVNLSVYANDISISRFSASEISVNENTDFGIVFEGDQAIREFLIINDGFNAVIIDEIFSGPGDFQPELSNVLVQPFDTVTLAVTFLPSFVGNQSGDIEIYYSFFNSNGTFNLTVGGISYVNESGPGTALSYGGMSSVQLDNGDHFSKSISEEFTIEAWVNFSSVGFFGVFTNIESSTGGDGYSLSVDDGQVIFTLQADQDLNSSISATSDGLIFDGEWTHIAASYDGSGSEFGLEVYINGERQVVTRNNNGFSGDINDFNRVLPELGVFGVSGFIDEFRIWNSVRTPEQIQDGLFNGVSPQEGDLNAYFRFDEGFGSEVIDLTGASRGTLSGVAPPVFAPSQAPVNNEETFETLTEKNGLWSVNQNEVVSANLQIFNSGFIQDNGDNIIFAHDLPGVSDDSFVTTDISLLQPLVDERLERSWYIEISDSLTNVGGSIDILFKNIPNDSTQTYYLLSTFEGLSDYFIVSYDGYNTISDTVFFTVQVDSIPEKAFFTLGRTNTFPGNALAFDGINDSTSSSSGVSHLEKFTYEAWVNIDPSSDDLGGLFSLRGSFGSYTTSYVTADGRLEFAVFDGSFTETIATTSTIRDGNWHHIAITRDFTNGLEIYVDGVFEDTVTPDISAAFFDGTIMMGANLAGSTFSNFKIDEFRIWNTRRTAEEIAENYESTVTPGNPDLILYHRFDQFTENLPDLSGSTTASTLYNFNFDLSTSGWVESTAFMQIEAENALDFDGSKPENDTQGDHISVPHLAELNIAESDFTLQAWVNPRDLDLETILSKGHGGGLGNPDVFIFQIQNGRLALQLSDGSSSEWIYSNRDVNTGEWTHVTASYESASRTVTFYQNGIPTGGGTFSIVPSNNGDTQPLFIGKQGHTCDCNYFDGQIDEVSIWSSALDDFTIKSLITKKLDPQSVGLVAYYDFNEGTPAGNNATVSQVPDLTVAENNGNLLNFTLAGTNSNFVISPIFDQVPKVTIVEVSENTQLFYGENLDYGVVFENDSVFTEFIIWNEGIDTLNITSAISYGPSVLPQDGLNRSVLPPFEGDTISFYFFPNAVNEFSGEPLLSFTTDDLANPSFDLIASAKGYPELPGAGNSLFFNGISDVASTPNSVDVLTNKSFSVEFWARRPDNTTPDFVFGNGPVAGLDNEQLHIGFKTGNVVTISFKGNDLDFLWTDANTDWNHFAFTYNAVTGDRRIVINGIEVAADVSPSNFIGEGSLYVGSASFGGNFEGSIEELRVWNFALPDSVIRTHMTRKLGSDVDFFLDSLIAYYRFDEGTGTDIFDLSENEAFGFNHLNLTGGTFEASGAYVGDGNLFTYTESEINTNVGVVESFITISNIADPSKGVHAFVIQDFNATSLSTDIYQDIQTNEVFGVFAPGGNSFDFNAGTASFGTDDSLRIVKRVDNTQTNDYFNVSGLFDVDIAADSVRSSNQNSGIFSIAKINYPSNADAGTALQIGTGGQQVGIVSPNQLTFGAFSLEAWVNVPSSNSGQTNFYTIRDPNGGADQQLIQFSVFNGNLYWFIRESDGVSGELFQGSTPVNDDTWHHVAYVRDGFNVSMYVDGVLDISSSLSFDTDIIFPADADALMEGDASIDEMRIWNTALSRDNILNFSYTNDLSLHPELNNLTNYYRFDDDTGSSRLLDLISDGHGDLMVIDPASGWIASGAFSVPANTVVSLADSGPGSLRDVIEQANQTPEMDTVKFDLPGAGPWVINTQSTITATDSVYIDGTTQPGWDIVTGAVVEINGSSTTPIGIVATSDYIEVYGMRFNAYANIGLELNNNVMSGSKIGSPGMGNIFINNGGVGLNISGADNSIIKSNFVGADFDGSEAGNDIGIFINNDANNNIVGDLVAEANVITANNVGVQVNDASSIGNLIRQNEFFCNISHGITLALDGNNNIAAPVITGVSETEVSGTGVDGQEIDVYDANDACDSNQGNGYLGMATVSGGVWSLTGLTLTEGNYVTATASTVTDGTSTFSERVRFAEPPANPTVNSANFNTLEPVITGTYELGTTLTVEIVGVTYVLGTDAQLTDVPDLDLDGITDWSLDLTGSPLSAEGTYDVIVNSTKELVGLSAMDQTTDEILIDTTLPTPPTVNDQIINNDRPVLTGTYEQGTDFTILLNSATYTLGTSPELTDDGSGNWTLDLSSLVTGLPEATYDVVLTSTDIGGNSSTDNSVDELTIDLTAPVVTVDVLVTQDVLPELTGTIDDNTATINVLVAGNNYAATNNGNGTWTLAAGTTVPGLASGTFEVVATATDLATNTATDLSTNELIVVGLPTATDATVIEPFSFTANWGTQDGIANYVLDVSEDIAFTQPLSGFENRAVTGNAELVTGLEYGTPYFYRVRSVIAVGDTTGYSNTISVITTISAETIADSLALVSIYNDMGGVDWTDNNNWLQGNQRIETWSGVSVINGRVASIDLSNRNVSGVFPLLSTGDLSELNSLLLNDNQISGLNDMTVLTSLTELRLENNQLTFADLVANASITGIVYSPQAVILEDQNEFVNEGEDLTLDRGTGNPGDIYTWFKDGTAIPGEVSPTLMLPNISFANEGNYRASVTNSNVPGLTLETNSIIVRVSSLERDSLALRQLYIEMNGSSWPDVNDWTSLPIAQWTGIGINANRVDSLNLSGQGLAGTLSSQIFDVRNLRYVNLSENSIENIPDLTSLSNITTLDITDNRLQFDDLIPNSGITGIDFSNQKPVDELLQDIYLPSGTDFELSVDVGGTGNVYNWKLGENEVQSGPNPVYQITGIQRSDMGVYLCEITNPAISGFSLNSNPRGVFAKAKISGTARISDTEVLTDGRVLLLQVNDGAYDTIDVLNLDITGTYTFDTLLADYVVSVDPTDVMTYIPTYHESTIQWDEATVIPLNNDINNIDMLVTVRPGDPSGGDGTFTGDVFTDFPDDGRIEARRRVRRVGVALRRRRSSNRTDMDIFDLFGYTQTDEEGKFSFGELPSGVYRIFIEYPGIPLREDAFTEFEITEDGKNNDVTITATVFEDGIEILGGITGIAKDYLDELTFYPNPVSNGSLFVKIEARRGYNIMFELIDLRGKTVLRENLSNHNVSGGRKQIDIQSLNQGMYLIRVTIPELENQVYYTGKLIINSNN